MKTFAETKFVKELDCYWENQVKVNFVKFCDPFRKDKHVFLSRLSSYEVQASQAIHLLDLKRHFMELNVIDNFITNNGQEAFEELYNEFLHNIYFYLDVEPCDMYFESIPLIRKDTFYVEVQCQDKEQFRKDDDQNL